MNDNFWAGFEKEAKKSDLLERIRLGLPVKLRGHSLKGIGKTRLGKILRSRK